MGATLLEVMVSVFLLTFGVLALMAAQIRSVSSISEAENQSIAAQAAEALAEGMQINPNIKLEGKNYIRRYDEYIGKEKNVTKSSSPISKISAVTKTDLAQAHISEFESILANQMVGANNIYYIICRDKANPSAPTLTSNNGTATFTPNCAPTNNRNDVTAIKIAWGMENNSQSSADNTNTYILQVAD